ncbi:MAG: hypothetical protein GTN36_02685 [Candidatus Aenigmarchaeota archaeon]|nr:hypothetical protein [Candidatus Aenigmarchaeota archaeon]
MKIYKDSWKIYPFGENSILFFTEYCFLNNLLDNRYLDKKKKLIKQIHEELWFEDKYKDDINTIENWSHDNHTALLCLFKKTYKRLPSYVEVFPVDFLYRTHPRDLIFYMYISNNKLLKFVSFWFLWVLSLTMIITCLQDYKYRNGLKILKTDGKILTWLRLQTVNMPITKWICNKIIEHKWTNWYYVFRYYFQQDDNHPIVKTAKKAFHPKDI